ncbi:MAG: hypothetical protein JW862_04215, partial [Anaerolineales bacterium]|nr:hypothetical protein [Anaerolineales bacterium]
MKSRLICTSILIALLALAAPAQAQEVPALQFGSALADYAFGELVHFEITLQSEQPLKQAWISIQPGEQTGAVLTRPADLSPGLASYDLDLASQALRPFIQVTYWFQVELQNGETFTSEKFSFEYRDNRFNWQSLE